MAIAVMVRPLAPKSVIRSRFLISTRWRPWMRIRYKHGVDDLLSRACFPKPKLMAIWFNTHSTDRLSCGTIVLAIFESVDVDAGLHTHTNVKNASSYQIPLWYNRMYSLRPRKRPLNAQRPQTQPVMRGP